VLSENNFFGVNFSAIDFAVRFEKGGDNLFGLLCRVLISSFSNISAIDFAVRFEKGGDDLFGLLFFLVFFGVVVIYINCDYYLN